MDDIEDIDGALSPISSRLAATAMLVPLTYVCELSDRETIAKQTYKGVYLIEVNTETENESHSYDEWIHQFKSEWDLPEYSKKFTCTTKKKRIFRHDTLLPWMPLYIGKSKKVGARVTEHIVLPLDARTFALKIEARPNMRQRRFRLRTLRLEIDNYDFIAPALESALRARFNPIVGRQ